MRRALLAVVWYLAVGTALTALYHHRHPDTFMERRTAWGYREPEYQVERQTWQAAACIVLWPACGISLLADEAIQ